MVKTRRKEESSKVSRRGNSGLVTNVWFFGILVIVIAAVALFFFPVSNTIPLPSYLDRCISRSLYHSHPSLQVIVNGVNTSIPANLGYTGKCIRPLHTHQSDGVVHVEPDLDRNYTVGDFLILWASSVNNPTIAIFNSTQIFRYKTDPSHNITMSVNGQLNSDFQNFMFPRNAASSGETCSPSPSCSPTVITIRYG